MTTDFAPHLVELQRAVHAARAAVEAHRTQVDTRRRADPRVETIPGQGLTLRWWTDAENSTLTELTTAAGTAQAEVRAALLTGPGLAYDTVQALKTAAREA